MWRIWSTALLAALSLSCLAEATAAPDPVLRPDSIIFNQVMPLTNESQAQFPLYFTRRGDYYLEAWLETAAGDTLREAVTVRVDMDIAREGDVLFAHDSDARFDASNPIATLFWLTTDREIPLKAPLVLSVRVEAAEVAPPAARLHLQMKRKPNIVYPRR